MQAKYGQGKSEALEAAFKEALADCAFLAPARVWRHIRLPVDCLPSDLHVFGAKWKEITAVVLPTHAFVSRDNHSEVSS